MTGKWCVLQSAEILKSIFLAWELYKTDGCHFDNRYYNKNVLTLMHQTNRASNAHTLLLLLNHTNKPRNGIDTSLWSCGVNFSRLRQIFSRIVQRIFVMAQSPEYNIFEQIFATSSLWQQPVGYYIENVNNGREGRQHHKYVEGFDVLMLLHARDVNTNNRYVK